MPNITTQNPLMLPVAYNGQVYFTAHYFHQQYRANKPEGGKYKLLGDFTRLIRKIEAYQLYVERGDIIDLEYKSLKSKTDAEFASVKAAFKENSYNPIMLINATAQVALTHHLDDEISKQVSVGVNEQATKSAKARTPKLLEVKDFYVSLAKDVAAMLGVNPALAFAGALAGIEEATGMPTESLRLTLPSAAPGRVGRLNPTKIGEALGMSARDVNLLLQGKGWQAKDDGGGWRLTDEGAMLGELVPFSRNGHASYQILWHEGVVDLLKGAAQ